MTMQANQFRNLIDSVSFAASESSSRYALSSVHLDCNGDTTAVSTDGVQLAYRTIEESAGIEGTFTLGRVETRKAAARIGKANSAIELTPDKHKVSLAWRSGRNKDVSAEIPLCEGRFPRWRECIPKPSDVTGSIHGRASALIHAFTPQPSFELDLGKRTIGKLPHAVHKDIEIHGDTVVLLDVNLLVNWLETLPEGSEVSIYIHGPDGAISAESGNAGYVLMPMTDNR